MGGRKRGSHALLGGFRVHSKVTALERVDRGAEASDHNIWGFNIDRLRSLLPPLEAFGIRVS